MRWSIIRVIWARELRDQMRDRRTVLMIVGLPLLLYPILGFAVLTFAMGFADTPSVVGVVRGPLAGDDFPSRSSETLPAALAIPVVPAPTCGVPVDWLTGVGILTHHPALQGHGIPVNYPLLIEDGKFLPIEGRSHTVGGQAKLDSRLQVKFLSSKDAEAALAQKDVDVLLSSVPGFWTRLSMDKQLRAAVEIRWRKADDKSRQATTRLHTVLNRWKDSFGAVHLQRKGLPQDLDDPFYFADPQMAEQITTGGNTALFDLFVKIFPFMLVMWSLAGALYPAVDVCAGEKERGTMETLLITPAGREEIVWGKFLTIWVFSGATALLNLASMAVTTSLFGSQLPQGALPLAAILWCVVLSLPLSAFFSAICLAVGAYARSSKEGQYYLMPLFLVTMPLIFLTLAPGVELNSFYSMVPVTGVALLMQRMMTATGFAQVPWFYFLSVLAPIALYSWLALRWAIEQFQREEVLFREAERLDVRLWLRSLFREKEESPTVAQAFFCFILLAILRWVSLGLGKDMPLLLRSGITLIAFMAAPPLFMAMLLTKRPWQGLSLRLPRPGYLLVGLLLLPLADAANLLLGLFPAVVQLLRERQMLVEESFAVAEPTSQFTWTFYVLSLAFLSALSKEIAFRGLILGGLRRRFQPWTAIFISSFLFALYHLNVFVLVPAFCLGMILGVLTWRSGSLVPAVLFHWGTYTVLILGVQWSESSVASEAWFWARLIFAAVCTGLALALLGRLRRRESGENESLAAPINLAPTAAQETVRGV